MARSGSPICAATRARVSIPEGPLVASFSIGFAAIAGSARANAASLSPRPMVVSAKISKQVEIFWLFLEERFEFAACFLPTLLRGGMIAGDMLCPA